MALAEVQAALARLYTDEAARAAFLDDPRGFAQGIGLDAPDATTLAAIAPQTLRRFAASLKARRVLDARRTMPLTAGLLGAEFAGHFHAAAPGPAAGRAAQVEALAARLARLARAGALAPAWIGDLARYEAAFAEAGRRRGVRLRLFRHPVGAIALALHAGAAPGEVGPRPTLAVWARLPGGRLVHRVRPRTPLPGA